MRPAVRAEPGRNTSGLRVAPPRAKGKITADRTADHPGRQGHGQRRLQGTWRESNDKIGEFGRTQGYREDHSAHRTSRAPQDGNC